MNETINSNDIRINNTRKILYTLRNSPPLTKKDLSEGLGLSLPTVASITKDLEAEGSVKEIGNADSSVGRKPLLIALNKDARYAVGVHISTHQIDIALVNFGGEILARVEEPFAFTGTESYWREVAEKVTNLITNSPADPEKIAGIRLAVPYVLLPDHWAAAKLKARPRNMLPLSHVPSFFPYDTDIVPVSMVAGVPRYWYGKIDKNSVVIYLTRYIEGCILTRDPISGLISSQTCDLGHMSLNYQGPDCFCGKKGCFQEYCSTSKVIDLIYGLDTSHDVIGRIPGKKLTGWNEFFRELEAGNSEYWAIWRNYLEMLAYAIHNIRLLLNYDIIICGDITDSISRYKDLLVDKIKEVCPGGQDDIVGYLHTSSLARYEASIGAALSRIDSLVH